MFDKWKLLLEWWMQIKYKIDIFNISNIILFVSIFNVLAISRNLLGNPFALSRHTFRFVIYWLWILIHWFAKSREFPSIMDHLELAMSRETKVCGCDTDSLWDLISLSFVPLPMARSWSSPPWLRELIHLSHLLQDLSHRELYYPTFLP